MKKQLEEMVQKLISKRNEVEIDLINTMLTRKGYPPFSGSDLKMRFPKVNITYCEADEYFYVFADNGTIQGDFIVAFKIESKTEFDYSQVNKLSASANTTSKLIWQDKDYSNVLMAEPLNENSALPLSNTNGSISGEGIDIMQKLVECIRYTVPRSNGLNEAYYKAKDFLKKHKGSDRTHN